YVFEVFRNPIYLEGLWNSFTLAVAALLLVSVIALPMAVLNAGYVYPGKSIFSSLILVPMILPPFVGAIGFRQFWGQAGVFNSLLLALGLPDWMAVDWLGVSRFWGVALAMALHLYPILYLNTVAALANLDPAMEEAARNLGAGKWLRFRKVTYPLMLPGLFAGGTIVFIWAFTELGTPLMFDYTRVTSVQVFEALKEIGDNPLSYVLVVLLLASSVILYGAGRATLKSGERAMVSRGGRGSTEKQLTGWRCGLALVFLLLVTGAAMLPHIGVVLVSFSQDWYATVLPERWTLGHYRDALEHSFTVPSIANSLRYAGIASLVDLVIGVAAAWIVVRTRLPGRAILDSLLMAPLAVPGIVLAFGYLAMTQPGEWFQFLDPSVDPALLLVIAYSIRRLPYVVRSVIAGLEQSSESLEEAGRNLGAAPMRVLRRITLPLVSANLVAGAILAFCFAMLEVSDSLMLAQKQMDYPITKARNP
ncbi:MAG: iron ABC transporter permease, partial [Candidatus Omnitrophica bacterium COP1]|nr:iron ABC transporter permease [Candidatus Omnitrophica bacterium COP1]